MEDEPKLDFVLQWTTEAGDGNQLHFEWHGDAWKKAQELMEAHKSGKARLLSLQIATYEIFIN